MRKGISSRSGFTLIELLVVIAIIAILAAILFPVFAKAREKARQAACLSNIKQLSLGLVMYREDYDEVNVPVGNEDGPGAPGGMWLTSQGLPTSWCWQQLLYPYTKNIAIASCPNAPVLKETPWAGNYGLNLDFCPSWWDWSKGSDGSMQNPSGVAAIMDCGAIYFNWWGFCTPSAQEYLPGMGQYASQFTAHNIIAPTGTNGNINSSSDTAISSVLASDYMTGRHSGGVNIGYFDGHAKWMTTLAVMGEVYKATFVKKTGIFVDAQ